jgi:hypothetical protein
MIVLGTFAAGNLFYLNAVQSFDFRWCFNEIVFNVTQTQLLVGVVSPAVNFSIAGESTGIG